jgi:hypothetical protein
MKRFLLAVIVILGIAASAQAQGGPPRQRTYIPAPKFSPYLYLSRGSVGGVPAYYAWVRPRIDYDQRARTVDNELGMVERQQQQLEQGGDLYSGVVGRPSTAARYMYYDHFYSNPSAAAPRR